MKKTYQAWAKTKNDDKLFLYEIKKNNMAEAQEWFKKNTIEHERVYLKK